MNLIQINPQRIRYMMEIWGWNECQLLAHINRSPKSVTIKKEDIFNENIKISHLKKVDEIFDKGLSFYTDPTPLKVRKRASIFFRKMQFHKGLTPDDRGIVHKVETRSHALSALSKLAGYPTKRALPRFKIENDPRQAAYKIREYLYPRGKPGGDQKFLSELISAFAEKNILVLEFPEERSETNLDGFFITTPQTIGVKYNRKAVRREIFTLVHELGHYLLSVEDLDALQWSNTTPPPEERWCNTFAFHFLAGKDGFVRIKSIKNDDISVNNGEVIAILEDYPISRLALFYNFFMIKKVTYEKFNALKKQSHLQAKKSDRNSGRRTTGVIISPLERDIYLSAFYKGVIEEYDLLAHFKKDSIDDITDKV